LRCLCQTPRVMRLWRLGSWDCTLGWASLAAEQGALLDQSRVLDQDRKSGLPFGSDSLVKARMGESASALRYQLSSRSRDAGWLAGRPPTR
jgi:hypothetical protein